MLHIDIASLRPSDIWTRVPEASPLLGDVVVQRFSSFSAPGSIFSKDNLLWPTYLSPWHFSWSCNLQEPHLHHALHPRVLTLPTICLCKTPVHHSPSSGFCVGRRGWRPPPLVLSRPALPQSSWPYQVLYQFPSRPCANTSHHGYLLAQQFFSCPIKKSAHDFLKEWFSTFFIRGTLKKC